MLTTKEEAAVFAAKFVDDLNVLLRARMDVHNMIGSNENSIIRRIMLHNAGFLEAMQRSGAESAAALGKLPPELRHMLERDPPEGIYAWYTDGYNHGFKTCTTGSRTPGPCSRASALTDATTAPRTPCRGRHSRMYTPAPHASTRTI